VENCAVMGDGCCVSGAIVLPLYYLRPDNLKPVEPVF
jgi:hypothetical protein